MGKGGRSGVCTHPVEKMTSDRGLGHVSANAATRANGESKGISTMFVHLIHQMKELRAQE